ncbi:bacillithiol system redox-active protein YtxJ [Flavobacterium difficile]|uniref:Bacillithiol system redox-active protein YtxJ n=1 Tax=Flavobacterium difficile TaxID=2709659 RepID=A0ABX0I2N2_9FLAO|nr:bacillithiol system redox-active protein YtxJ [Flavobacterium difficile]NHM01440.1 bacillithiol system redox-active protein YtxJ [Flavobacterium difficile]
MSFFKNIFGENKSEDKQSENVEAKFFTLNKIEQFDEIDAISHTKPVVLFKHSTRCIISRTVLKQFDNDFQFPEEKIDWYLLDLLNHRDLSNEIASRYNVVHQSPQIVVIKNGKAVFNESHDRISVDDLKQFT